MYSSINNFVDTILGFLNSVVGTLTGVALVLFLFGCIRFIYTNTGSEMAYKRGREILKWGLIALFVLVSIWGILQMMQQAFLPA